MGGTVYEVDPGLAGETVVLLWGLYDSDLYVEFEGQRSGPYVPVDGPIPLNRYRSFKKTAADEKADRIRQLADQLGLPIAALTHEQDLELTAPAPAAATLPRQPFPADALDDQYPNRITAKLAIADEIALPLVKLDPDDRAFIDQLLTETLVRPVVLARVRAHFRHKEHPGDRHAD